MHGHPAWTAVCGEDLAQWPYSIGTCIGQVYKVGIMSFAV